MFSGPSSTRALDDARSDEQKEYDAWMEVLSTALERKLRTIR